MQNRPAVTLQAIIAALIAGVPVIAKLLVVWGVYAVTKEQQDALTEALQWAALVAGALLAHDLGLRAARNHADAKRASGDVRVPVKLDGHTIAAAVGAAKTELAADVEGGDHGDPLPHIRVKAPGTIPADQGDVGHA